MIEISILLIEKNYSYMFKYDTYGKYRMTKEFKSWTDECLQDFWFYIIIENMCNNPVFYFKSSADAMIFKLAFFKTDELIS